MKNNELGQKVGDSKTPPLMATESGLRDGTEQAAHVQADMSKPALHCTVLSELVVSNSLANGTNSHFTCRQKLWFSFFFDGTGNNRDADVDFKKRSNVAKLFDAHVMDNKIKGIYSIYIPGVATYFPAVDDDGGGVAGKVAGAKGAERINFALREMDKRLRRHLELAKAPSNAIDEINIAVFGFSRGASLARAFVNNLLATRCKIDNKKFSLNNGGWPLRLRFMGLFDTVASVGKPMSYGTTNTWGVIWSNVPRIIQKRLSDYRETRPEALAFFKKGAPGADPAVGSAHGHSGYGGDLLIHEGVEEVRHFVAAHEMRNSFPVDSISVLKDGKILKPPHFYETVYPGVHSDIGGSYAPGEGGRSPSQAEKFGVIPLTHMYQYALRAGVPMRNPGAWIEVNSEDFLASEKLTTSYDHYIKMINAPGTLGQVINNHMQLYYAWRFRSIRRKQLGEKSEAAGIASASSKFKAVAAPIDRKLAALQNDVDAANMRVTDLRNQSRDYEMDSANANSQAHIRFLQEDVGKARAEYEAARQKFLKEKARKDSLPDMSNFQKLLDLYDQQLLRDTQAILAVLAKINPHFTRADLRPHYRVLVEAYEAEFIHHKGLTDKAIIQFFDDYVHDSLAGFGSDATIPSDPRVVYVGGNEKLAYASLEDGAQDAQVA